MSSFGQVFDSKIACRMYFKLLFDPFDDNKPPRASHHHIIALLYDWFAKRKSQEYENKDNTGVLIIILEVIVIGIQNDIQRTSWYRVGYCSAANKEVQALVCVSWITSTIQRLKLLWKFQLICNDTWQDMPIFSTTFTMYHRMIWKICGLPILCQ